VTRTGSVCSGYEGLGQAVAQVLGGELAWVADNDPGAAAVLAHHYPSVKNLGDITAVDWEAAEPIEIMAGGFPCQDVSAAGARAGLKHGNRSGLWHEFVKAIAVHRPGLIVIENVTGLLTARGDEPTDEHLAAEARRDTLARLAEWPENELGLTVARGDLARARACRARIARLKRLHKAAADRCAWHERRLIRAAGTVIASLTGLGYDAEWTVVSAAAAGACHRRARIFILAFPSSGRAVAGAPVAAVRDGAWYEPDESLFGAAPYAGRVPASGTLASGRVYTAADAPAAIAAGALLKTPTAQLAVNGGSQHPDKRRAGGHGPTLADQVEHELLPTPMTGYSGRTPQEWRAGNATDWGPYAAGIARWEAVVGRPAPAPTVAGKTGRRLNPELPEWMMGLPEGWITGVAGLSRNAMLKLAGNGVVPQQGALALRILLARAGVTAARRAA
jgi:DNA (cytosine-5)-methyltransferase 1